MLRLMPNAAAIVVEVNPEKQGLKPYKSAVSILFRPRCRSESRKTRIETMVCPFILSSTFTL